MSNRVDQLASVLNIAATQIEAAEEEKKDVVQVLVEPVVIDEEEILLQR